MKLWLIVAAACAVLGLARAPQLPRPGTVYRVSATAYCETGITRSGEPTRRGIVAADPRLLPLGTVIRVEGLAARRNGVYTVTDTGRDIKGREIDIFIPNCSTAERFGRQTARVRVLRRAKVPTVR